MGELDCESLLRHIPQVLSEAKLILIHLMSLQFFKNDFGKKENKSNII